MLFCVQRILIATWGRPWKSLLDNTFAWEVVEYVFRVEKRNFSGKSRSTLPLLKDVLEPDLIVLVVLDTALSIVPNNYEELVRRVVDGYRDFIRDELKLQCDVDFIVAPGVGRFESDGGYVNFRGSLMDFYYYVLFMLSKILVKLDDKSMVYLDISHGINFMPTLTYRALNEVLGIIAYSKKIGLEVYNAEPVRGKESISTIHLVETRRSVQPRISANPLGETGACQLLKIHSDNTDLVRKLSEHTKVETAEVRHLNVFLSAMVNGFPLALYTYYPSYEKMLGRLEKVVEIWRSQTVVQENVSVNRMATFTEDFMRYARIWAAAYTLNLTEKEEVDFNELKEVKDKFFSFYGHNKGLVSRGIHDVEEALDKLSQPGWVKLGSISGKTVGGFSPDNFLAHAGFEYNVTEICRTEDGRVLLRYDRNMRKEIEDACIKALFKM